MDIGAFNEFVAKFVGECKELLTTKGHEYAGPTDRFANFKRHAKAGRSALDVWDIYQSKHEDSIRTFLDEVLVVQKASYSDEHERAMAILTIFDRQSEPILGRFHDKVNYLILGAGLLGEIYEEAAAIRDRQ